jgi:hypothetical protein
METDYEAVELQVSVKVNLSVHMISPLTVANIFHFLIDFSVFLN